MRKLRSTRLAWPARACLILAFLASLPGASLAGDSDAAAAALPPRIRVASDLVSLRQAARFSPTDNLGVYYLADVADAYVSAEDPNFQGGREPSLMVGLTPEFGYRRWSYLRFDHEPLPDDAVILSATLHLYLFEYTGEGPRSVDVYAVLNPWEESGAGGITWNNRPRGAIRLSSQDVNSGQGRRTLDVTNAVQAWVGGLMDNYGLRLNLTDETGDLDERRFYSREAAWGNPYIEVTYTTAGVPPESPPPPDYGQRTDFEAPDLSIVVEPGVPVAGSPMVVTARATDTGGSGVYRVLLERDRALADDQIHRPGVPSLEASETVTPVAGVYRYSARAWDAQMNGRSASVVVRVLHEVDSPQVWVDHSPPNPEPGTPVTFRADAESASPIVQLDIIVDGTRHPTSYDPPVDSPTVTWDYTDTDGIYVLRYRAEVTDADGLSASSGEQYVLFGNDPEASSDEDSLSDEIEEALGLDPEDSDTDGDGLYDHWEVLGYDADRDGVIDVDLPAMGATPFQKDVFWEIDWMVKSPTQTYAYQPEAIQATINAYLDHGVHLHVDTGQYGGGEPLPYDDTRLRNGQNDGTAWFNDTKRYHFDCSRRGVFYYAAVAYGVRERQDPPVESMLILGSYLGSGNIYLINRYDSRPDSRAMQTEVLFHELGHGMGLGHGGQAASNRTASTLGPDGRIETQEIDWISVGPNYKPNYLSVMNYQYQAETDLTVQTESGERIFIYRYHTLPDSVLDETNLDESEGFVAQGELGTYVWRRTDSASELLHSIYEPKFVTYEIWWGGTDFNARALADGSPIDWNRNGTEEGSIPATDLNPYDGHRITTALTATNEVNSLRTKIYGGGIFSDSDGCPGASAAWSPPYQEEEPHEDVSGELRTDGEYPDGVDNDGDGLIDEGFPDSDGDGIANGIDNCMLTYNPDQLDADRNYLGDACEGLPDAPANPILQGGGSQAALYWTPSSKANVIGYNVYRRLPDENGFKRLGGDYPTTLETTQFGDDTCVEGARYRVTAVDLYMKESAFSETVVQAEGDCQPAQATACAGYAGLAIGVPDEDIDTYENAGAFNVLYGSRASLTSYRSQFWEQDSPGIRGYSETGDKMGLALAGGDFDGDGYEDLAVGVPHEDIGSIVHGGGVRILRGSRNGLTANEEGWNQDTPGVPGDPDADDEFGATLASGDFDGDGYEDLAIGVPGETASTASGAGAVLVLYGSDGGLTASGLQQWDQESPGIPGESREGDRFGAALAVGDLNGDGYADLAVGVPDEAIGTIIGAGSVRILYGSASGLTATDESWTQDTPGVPDRAEALDKFGTVLATGYFDDDRYADLAVGAPGESLVGATMAGAVTVLYGSASGLTASGSQQWHQDSPGIPDAAENWDLFGSALAVGDFDRSGQDDLAVGVPGETVGTVSGAGAVDVLYGAPGGLHSSGSQHWHQGSPGVDAAPEAGNRFGFALAAGDFDDDQHDDLAIGVPDEGLQATAQAGVIRLLDGSPDGLVGHSRGWSQDSAGVPDVAEAGDRFGHALAAGNWCGTVHYIYLPLVIIK